jgi:hypothetical protein
MMKLRRALTALFIAGIAVLAPTLTAADAATASPTSTAVQAPQKCYSSVEEANAALNQKAKESGNQGRVMVPVCFASTGQTRCNSATHTLECLMWCKDCDGLVCTQPTLRWQPCGSC